MQAKTGTNYYAGNTLAYAGKLGGYWLVNGRIFTQTPAYLGAGRVWAGNTVARAGYYTGFIQTETTYTTPTDPIYWPFCFFVGGVATVDSSLSITGIEQAFVPNEQRKQLEDIILKFKPAFSWAAMIITYT
ncbi:MAG: hypothetical protein GY869_22015 [Planctomycetes bacterium]|nr:hypothetical protein [Planctomycetota bacterium]